MVDADDCADVLENLTVDTHVDGVRLKIFIPNFKNIFINGNW